MKSNRDVPLGSLIKPAKVIKAGDGSYPILSMTMHNGLMDQNQKFKKPIASNDLSGYKVVKRGQLVVSFPIDEGVLDFQQLYDEAIVSPAYGIWDLVDVEDVDINYLGLALKSDRSLAYYKAKLQGSTARRRSLPKDVFLALPIHLPNINEQKRIVEQHRLKKLIEQKRERQQELFEELKVARFRQIQSSSQLRTYTLGELITYIQAGESPKCESYPASSEKPGILKLSALAGRKFNELENKQVLEEFIPNEKHRIIKGDILMSRKNTPELVGTVQFVEEEPATEIYTPDLIYRIKLDETKILPEYFLQLSRTQDFRAKIRLISSGSSRSMSNISKDRLSKITVTLPNISSQKLINIK